MKAQEKFSKSANRLKERRMKPFWQAASRLSGHFFGTQKKRPPKMSKILGWDFEPRSCQFWKHTLDGAGVGRGGGGIWKIFQHAADDLRKNAKWELKTKIIMTV
jgi:hypothetical protein